MQPPISPGTLIHLRYHLAGILAQGRFGWTYLAEDQKRAGELCTLQELVLTITDPTLVPPLREALQATAAPLTELHHPQLARFRVVIVDDERIFWVEDFVPGKSLGLILQKRQAGGQGFSESEVVQILWRTLPALAYLHRRGVVHGNLSPETLVLQETEQLPVLIHPGRVEAIAAGLQLGYGWGEAIAQARQTYLPPGVLAIDPPDPSHDLYALAVTALILLTGQPPEALYDAATQTWNWDPWVTLSPPFAKLLRHLLLQNPQARPPSAVRVAQILKPLLPVSEPAAQPTEESPKRPSPPKPLRGDLRPGWQSPQAVVFIGFSLVLLTAGIGWEWLVSGKGAPSQKSSPAPIAAETPVAPTPPPVQSEPPPAAIRPKPSPQKPLKEESTQEALRDRRRKLNVNYDFFVDLVDEAFYARHPQLKGQSLAKSPEQAQLRQEWNAIAEILLNRLELLSQESRSRLGTYGRADYDRWLGEARQQRLGRQTVETLADHRFYNLFPEQEGKPLAPGQFSQIWYGVFNDQIGAIRQKTIVETLEPGSVQTSGTLKPGQGKVFLAYLERGNATQIILQMPGQSTRLSIYPPVDAGETPPLLKASSTLTWSGTVARSGYYEIVVVSQNPEPLGYQLQIKQGS